MRKRRKKGNGTPGKKARTPSPIHSETTTSEPCLNGEVNSELKNDNASSVKGSPEKEKEVKKEALENGNNHTDAKVTDKKDAISAEDNPLYKGYVTDVEKFCDKPKFAPALADQIQKPRQEANLDHCDKPNFLHNLGEIFLSRVNLAEKNLIPRYFQTSSLPTMSTCC